MHQSIKALVGDRGVIEYHINIFKRRYKRALAKDDFEVIVCHITWKAWMEQIFTISTGRRRSNFFTGMSRRGRL